MGEKEGSSPVQRMSVAAAGKAGMFEVLFSRLSNRESLRSFYARQVFAPGADVPEDLVEYAFRTTHTRGAHLAPHRFILGDLFMHEYATRGYANLSRPTLIVVPERSASSVQDFAAVERVAGNNDDIAVHRIDTGLLPQWEAPDVLMDVLKPFLEPSITNASIAG